jgi:hypothetical protein
MLYDSEYDKEAPVVLDARRLTSLELNKLLQSNDEMSLDYQNGLEYKQNIWIENEKNSNSDGFTLVKNRGTTKLQIPKFLETTPIIWDAGI